MVIHADFVKWLQGNQWLVQHGHIEKYHAVLADPPYGIDFMSKGWDAYTPQNYQAWVTEWALMLLDFVHPGGVLMMFGGTRHSVVSISARRVRMRATTSRKVSSSAKTASSICKN